VNSDSPLSLSLSCFILTANLSWFEGEGNDGEGKLFVLSGVHLFFKDLTVFCYFGLVSAVI